jgi:EpsI family protein
MTRLNTLICSKAAAFATIILIGQALIYYTGSGKEVIPAVAPWRQFPAVVDDWKSVADIPLDQDVLDQLKPDDYLNRNYSSDGDPSPVNFFVGYFNSRRNGRAPHSPEWCLPGAGWKSVSTDVIKIPVLGDSKSLPANEYLIEKGVSRELVLYWYHQGTRVEANMVVAQMYSLPDLIMHGRTDTALVRIIVPVQGTDMTGAKHTAEAFAQDVYPLVRGHIL